jgi:hypothetical protein
MREEQTLAEIEDFIEGFNQPTCRGMRINGIRVATWSSRDGWVRGQAAGCGVAPVTLSYRLLRNRAFRFRPPRSWKCLVAQDDKRKPAGVGFCHQSKNLLVRNTLETGPGHWGFRSIPIQFSGYSPRRLPGGSRMDLARGRRHPRESRATRRSSDKRDASPPPFDAPPLGNCLLPLLLVVDLLHPFDGFGVERFLDGDVCPRGSSRSVVKRISERTISRACGLG